MKAHSQTDRHSKDRNESGSVRKYESGVRGTRIFEPFQLVCHWSFPFILSILTCTSAIPFQPELRTTKQLHTQMSTAKAVMFYDCHCSRCRGPKKKWIRQTLSSTFNKRSIQQTETNTMKLLRIERKKAIETRKRMEKKSKMNRKAQNKERINRRCSNHTRSVFIDTPNLISWISSLFAN